MNPKEFDMSIQTLAEPTYGISEFGQAAMLPAGTEVERVSGLIKQGPPGTLTVLADTGDPEMDAWYVTASALRFEEDPCGQCGHPRGTHRLYTVDGDDEPWSFCSDCGHDCQFVAQGTSLGERLGFQPLHGRTHGYNGQEHR